MQVGRFGQLINGPHFTRPGEQRHAGGHQGGVVIVQAGLAVAVGHFLLKLLDPLRQGGFQIGPIQGQKLDIAGHRQAVEIAVFLLGLAEPLHVDRVAGKFDSEGAAHSAAHLHGQLFGGDHTDAGIGRQAGKAVALAAGALAPAVGGHGHNLLGQAGGGAVDHLANVLILAKHFHPAVLDGLVHFMGGQAQAAAADFIGHNVNHVAHAHPRPAAPAVNRLHLADGAQVGGVPADVKKAIGAHQLRFGETGASLFIECPGVKTAKGLVGGV